jgi:hypothetical protein
LKKLVIAIMVLVGSVLVATPVMAQDWTTDQSYIDPEAYWQGYIDPDPYWEGSTYCDQGVCYVYECPTYSLGPCEYLYSYELFQFTEIEE